MAWEAVAMKKRKNNLKKEEEENVEEDVVVKVLEESMAPKRSYSEVWECCVDNLL